MLGIANDVMMCTNRKTCWWNGGNVLETFLKGVTRLGIKNSVTITLDDATEQFCRDFPGEVTSIRMELPVPTAQQGSRGANMISTLKYGLLRQALLMGFSVLVVDLDLVFLRNPLTISTVTRTWRLQPMASMQRGQEARSDRCTSRRWVGELVGSTYSTSL